MLETEIPELKAFFLRLQEIKSQAEFENPSPL